MGSREYPCRDIVRRLRRYGFKIQPARGSHTVVYCEKDAPERGFPFYCADLTDSVKEYWIKKLARHFGMDWREITESSTEHRRRRKAGKLSKPCP